MKQYIIALLLVAVTGIAYAAGGALILENSNRSIAIQGFAPNGKQDVSLAGTSVTTDMRSNVGWSAYCAADSSYRTMSTATKVGTSKTIPATSWHTRVINPSTPFINMTGCTGVIERH